ncbi:hypothetical protein Dip518_000363 [Parelusimicrobium proximum]|uniref:hypothetical protein n=1 Tax=Parelusimicrobium proximum TaxID=3228953 RepID=UPI003D17FFB8
MWKKIFILSLAVMMSGCFDTDSDTSARDKNKPSASLPKASLKPKAASVIPSEELDNILSQLDGIYASALSDMRANGMESEAVKVKSIIEEMKREIISSARAAKDKNTFYTDTLPAVEDKYNAKMKALEEELRNAAFKDAVSNLKENLKALYKQLSPKLNDKQKTQLKSLLSVYVSDVNTALANPSVTAEYKVREVGRIEQEHTAAINNFIKTTNAAMKRETLSKLWSYFAAALTDIRSRYGADAAADSERVLRAMFEDVQMIASAYKTEPELRAKVAELDINYTAKLNSVLAKYAYQLPQEAYAQAPETPEERAARAERGRDAKRFKTLVDNYTVNMANVVRGVSNPNFNQNSFMRELKSTQEDMENFAVSMEKKYGKDAGGYTRNYFAKSIASVNESFEKNPAMSGQQLEYAAEESTKKAVSDFDTMLAYMAAKKRQESLKSGKKAAFQAPPAQTPSTSPVSGVNPANGAAGAQSAEPDLSGLRIPRRGGGAVNRVQREKVEFEVMNPEYVPSMTQHILDTLQEEKVSAKAKNISKEEAAQQSAPAGGMPKKSKKGE